MALDVQRNWTVSMEKNFAKVKMSSAGGRTPQAPAPVSQGDILSAPVSRRHTTRDPVHLPDEIVLHILDYISAAAAAQATFRTCALLSRQWYQAAIPYLYRYPFLYGKNFDPFVRTICPSINAHIRRSPIAELVKVLDMSYLVHHGSKSLTARLLGRTKGSLEGFVAPQSSFAINCFAALAKCRKLRLLDLSLISESISLAALFHTLKSLDRVKVLRLPRSSRFEDFDPATCFWPPKLESLTLSGGMETRVMASLFNFPDTLNELTIEHCPFVISLSPLFQNIRNLPIKTLKVAHMPRLPSNSLDNILAACPRVERLSVSTDYITPDLFDSNCQWASGNPSPHPLRVLELTSSGNPGESDKISPLDLIDEPMLVNLRVIRVAKTLGWRSKAIAEEVDGLATHLIEGSQRDWKDRRWIYADMRKEEYDQPECWRKHAGIWFIDG
ncbi:hypothetical protein LTR66_012443 [Elasticomyces elasticus]|nr:hypothetical protein LTR66_012443 [Elasticomyces elasticus]